MAFDPAADPVVNQTVQGVTANNLKTYGHFMDLVVQESAKDLLHEGRESRTFGRAVTARAVDMVMGSQVTDASADSIAGVNGLGAGQIGAKIAQTTPPETAVVSALNNVFALLQQQNQQQASQLQILLSLADKIGAK